MYIRIYTHAVTHTQHVQVITNIDRAPICLNALMLERPFASYPELVSSVRKHYKGQLVQQLYKLVGSFEFLGNPVGLVNNLGTGLLSYYRMCSLVLL